MKHLYTSRGMSRVFRGLVLGLAVLLVACGGGTDDPTPTATSGSEQAAQPTVPPLESTPDSSVSEDEIAVIAPEEPATPDAPQSTPASSDTSEALASEGTPLASPVDLVTVPETEEAEVEQDATAMAEADAVEPESEETIAGSESTPAPTQRARTGNETFDNPGDGTGGSGMPGESNGNLLDNDVPEATPLASPIAQLSVLGCDVPDVPGYAGDTTAFILTVDVNFRSGPGVDCDPLLDEPIGEGQTVEIIGGPVTQSEDDTEWVQIEIDGTPGWITTEFIEPVD